MAKRIEYLDSLRGLAATQVVIFHCLNIFPAFHAAQAHEEITNQAIRVLTNTPLHLLWEGDQAVTFFFVLSGFVLALPYFNQRAPYYPSYLIRRFFRIYVPYILVVIFSSFLLLFSLSRHPMPGTSDWFTPKWSHATDFTEYLKMIFMMGTMDNVDAPAWSLAWEMRISVIFPVICLMVGRLKGGVGFGLGVFLTMFSLLGLHFFQSLHMLTSAIFYSSFFIYGCVLAKYQEEVKAFLGKWTAWQKAALVLAALGLYNWEWEFSNVHYFGLDVKYNDLFTRTAPGLGSVLIISSALAFEKMQTILMNKKLLWVGKVSYSLYLIHMVVLQAAIYFFPGAIPLAGRVIFGGCLSFAVAGLSYQFLELPCINIGHALAKKLDGQRRLEPRKASTVL